MSQNRLPNSPHEIQDFGGVRVPSQILDLAGCEGREIKGVRFLDNLKSPENKEQLNQSGKERRIWERRSFG